MGQVNLSSILNVIISGIVGIICAGIATVTLQRTKRKDDEDKCDKRHKPLREVIEDIKERQEADRKRQAEELLAAQFALSGNFAEIRHGIDGLVAKDGETKAMIAAQGATMVELKDRVTELSHRVDTQVSELGRRLDQHCSQPHK